MPHYSAIRRALDATTVEGKTVTWTISEKKLEDKDKSILTSCMFDGLKFGMYLSRDNPEVGDGKVSLFNDETETVDIDCTVVVRDTKEEVKAKFGPLVDGLPSMSTRAHIIVPGLFSSIRGGVTVKVEVRSCEVARSEAVSRLRARLLQRRKEKEAEKAELEAVTKEKAEWNMEQVLADMGEIEINKKKKGKISEQVEKKEQKKRDIKMAKKIDKEIKEVLAEKAQVNKDVEELLEEQRRGRDRTEELRRCLAEEVRNREATERSLGEQVAEEERRGRYLVEELRKIEENKSSLGEEGKRQRQAMEDMRQEVGQGVVQEEVRQLGAIPKVRPAAPPAAAPRQAARPDCAALQAGRLGADRRSRLADASRARRSVERMVQMLEERGRLAYLPTSSLRRLVAQLRSRLGGLSDLSLIHVEEELARMAEEEEASKAQKSVERMVGLLEERGRLASLPTSSLRRLVAQLRARLGGLSDLSLVYVEGEVARMAAREKVA